MRRLSAWSDPERVRRVPAGLRQDATPTSELGGPDVMEMSRLETTVTGRAPSAMSVLRGWPARRWIGASVGAVSTVLVVGLPTVLIPNSVFARAVPVTWWAWPVLVITAVLAGLLGATYIRDTGAPAAKASTRAGLVGGFLSYLAVGCPVCNKIALLALGYTGALRWFAPAQPWLAAAGVGLLAYAFYRRLRGEIACAVPSPTAR
ncbi:MAG: hypothetical protein ACYC1E_09575 [Propionibacteriaceae bacterium]